MCITMKQTVNQRLKIVIEDLNIKQKQFAAFLDVDHSTVSKWLKDGNSIPEDKLEQICESLSIEESWLFDGAGIPYAHGLDVTKKNFKEGSAKAITKESKEVNPWRDEAYMALKAERDSYKLQAERVWQMLERITGSKTPNFHKATKGAGVVEYFLPGKGFDTSLVASAVS